MTKHITSTSIHKFTNLLICAECGSVLTYNENNGQPRYICNSRHNKAQKDTTNTPHRFIDSYDVQDWFSVRLQRANDSANFVDQLLFGVSIKSMINEQLSKTTNTFFEISSYANQLSEPQTDKSFTAKVDFLRKKLRLIQIDCENLDYQITTLLENPDREVMLHEINGMGLDIFWLQPDIEINKTLRQLMGIRCCCVQQGVITGVVVPIESSIDSNV